MLAWRAGAVECAAGSLSPDPRNPRLVVDMPSEQLIQAAMLKLGRSSAERRENMLTALVAAKLSKEMEGVSMVMDPHLARALQPIIDDPVVLETFIEALNRLQKMEKKKSGFFGRLFGRK